MSVRLLVFVVAISSAWPTFAQSPGEQVDALHDALVNAMRQNVGQVEREALLREVVGATFDFQSIARISSGRQWRSFDDAQKDELAALLLELTTATYADRFAEDKGHAFVRGEIAESRTGAIVKTELRRTDGDDVPIDYYFRGDKVFNVVANGVSDLSLRRADYNSILKSAGYPALVEHLRESIEAHRSSE